MDSNSKKLSAISLWALWYRRNKFVNEGLKYEFHELVGFVQSYGQDLSFAKAKDLTTGMQRNGLWRPPKPGIIKLNFDASFENNSNFSISAVLARDSEGLIMGACTYPIVDVADAFVAEARACERALYFAWDMGFRKVVVEGDSLTVIKKLETNFKIDLFSALFLNTFEFWLKLWLRFSESPGVFVKFSLPIVWNSAADLLGSLLLSVLSSL
ncbi:uncharacterized protein LOC128041686 [Gossypium raimondii]|uniref:uncharacterized protein LOC128041686 n=1 Tax=Gossypium raimondii TaxID=29730 RepID=UPI00227C55D3|nr:uncharacterized protein LOC128041686 [Gossypium raimondii]